MALLKERLVHALLMPLLLGLLQLRPLAEQCAALEAEKILVEEKKYHSLSSRSSYMALCVCRANYCWELSVSCLCIWSTLNGKRVGSQLERSEMTPILMEIHHIALCSVSSSIYRGIWLRKNLRLYSRCCLVCAWNG